MDAQAQETEVATELAFAHLRDAMAHRDQEAVTSISYRLLNAGHKFDAILEEAVSAVDDIQNKKNDSTGSGVIRRRRFRYASLVVSGVFVVLSTTTTDIGSRTQLPSEKKVVLTNETQMRVALYQALSHGTHSEMPNWLQYKVRDITHAIDEEIANSRAFTITAGQGLSNAGQNTASYQQPSLPETAQTDPPLSGATSRSTPNVVQVQKRSSKTAAGESSAADLQSYISRGDQLVANGDVAGARVFYQRAAEYGSAIAAKRLGATYDPKILAQAGLPVLLANEDAARLWYKLAQGLQDNNR